MGIDGFLGTRGSFMLDLVVTSMVVAIPLLLWSISLPGRKRFAWHRALQSALGVTLLVAVVLFEIEIRLFGWRERAYASRFWRDGAMNDWVDYSLVVHLLFAIPTPLLWIVVTVAAWRHFANPPIPGPHSRFHRFWGRVAAYLLVGTGITGWIFYWCAFVA